MGCRLQALQLATGQGGKGPTGAHILTVGVDHACAVAGRASAFGVGAEKRRALPCQEGVLAWLDLLVDGGPAKAEPKQALL